jgi:antitoxin (DNA-binding transcriptional repressor) of toxin-antitoxin stability system
MKKATLEKVQARLPEYIASSAKSPVVILQNGEPVAMLVGLPRGEKGTPLKLREILRQSWEDYKKNGGTPHDQFWAELASEAERP